MHSSQLLPFWYSVVSQTKLFSQEGAKASRCHFDQFLSYVKFSSFVYLRVVDSPHGRRGREVQRITGSVTAARE